MASRFPRPTNRKSPKTAFLVVCEGETEAYYFEGFNTDYGDRIHLVAKVNRGDQEQLVDAAISLKSAQARYDQVWCVFDCENMTQEKFDQVLAKARRGGIKVAFSTICFEIWPLLHFDFFDSSISANIAAEKLTNKLEQPYIKPMRGLHGLLRDQQNTAFINAERLLSRYPNKTLINNDPFTNVDVLVREIKRFSGRRG